MCISRGITISSPLISITHAIFQPNATNVDALYQMAGRICGNHKQTPGWVRPIVFSTEATRARICALELKAINLAEKAFADNADVVDVAKYSMADSPYNYFQLGPFDSVALLLTALKEVPKFAGLNKIRESWHPDGRVPASLTTTQYRWREARGCRLSLADYNNIGRNSSLSETNQYIVVPVYHTLDADEVVRWYVRYMVLAEAR